jgi:hypothetical protein
MSAEATGALAYAYRNRPPQFLTVSLTVAAAEADCARFQQHYPNTPLPNFYARRLVDAKAGTATTLAINPAFDAFMAEVFA